MTQCTCTEPQLYLVGCDCQRPTRMTATKSRTISRSVSQVFTVRAEDGGFVGSYRATTPKQAISRAVSEFAAAASVKWGAVPMPKGFDKLTASVESRVD